MQKIRGACDPKISSPTYGKDYADIGTLKRIADELGIAILLVHHLRKMQDRDDPFNEISGTTGLMGAADTILLLKKANREKNGANLYLTGRDIEFRTLALEFENCFWKITEDIPPPTIRPISPIVKKVCEYIKIHKYFKGSASELLSLLEEENIKPNVLTRSLSSEAFNYLQDEKIIYSSGRTGNGRWLELTLNLSNIDDGNDDTDEKNAIENLAT